MKNKRTHLARFILIGAVMLGTIGCDQSSKHLARTMLSSDRSISCLSGTLTLRLAMNDGAFLGLGSRLPALARMGIFCVGVGTAIAASLLYVGLSEHLTRRAIFAAALVLAGGTANLIDRLVFGGYVTDFLVLSAGRVRTGVFNLADVAILCGTGLFLYEYYRESKRTLRRNSESGAGAS